METDGYDTGEPVYENTQHKHNKVHFLRPLYENLRSAVSKGVRKSSNVYEVYGEEYSSGGEDGALRKDSGDGCIYENRAMFLNLTDGNSTDDSGIDSICSPTGDGGSEAAKSRDYAEIKFGSEDKAGTNKHKSFLHNTYADGLDSAVWKRDLNITGSLTRSKENLVDCVELTSVRTRDCVSPPIPLYSAVNKSTKKKKPEEKTTKTVSQVTLEGLAGGEITVKELKELSSILVSTNTALQRNSNLRASLTISVRKPGKTVKFTTPKTARKNKGPSYVPTKCPPLAPSPLLGRVAASALGSGSALPTSPLALPPSLALLSSPRNQGKGSPHAKRRFAVNPPVKQISPLVKPVPDVLTESSEEEEEEEEIEVEEEEDQGDKEEEKMEDENEDHFDKDESRNEKPKEKLRKVNIDAEHVMTNKKGNDRCEDTTNHSRVESRNQVSVETGKSANFDVEKSTKLNPEPFVRSYRTNRSSRGVPANRLSMAVRPQTVATLASKFDSLGQNKGVFSRNPGGANLTQRTYDITRIITQLNKTVTSKSGNSSDKTSNPLNLETKSTNKSFPEVRPISQVLKNTESVLLNDSKNGNKVKKDLSKNSYVELDKSEAKSELTSRLYKSETGNHSVRERQLLLLQKTGGINNNDIRFTTTHQVNKKEQGPRTKSEEPRVLEETRNNSKVSEGTRNTTEEPKTAEGTGNKTTRNQKTIPKSDSVKEVREVLQGQRANHGSPNTAVLRNTSGRSETVSVTAVTAGPSSKNPPAETKTRSSQIHENEKTRGHFVSSSHTESALHQQEKESEYWNCRKLHYSKDSLLDPDYIDMGDIDESNTISEAINNYSELVKAVPALILEDLDSTSLCEEEYEPISHQGHEISFPPNSRYAEEGSDVYSDYSMTASSRGEKCGFGNGSARSSILERGSQVSDRSDEWIDIDTDDDYDTRRFSRPQLSFVRASIRASKRRGSGGGAAEVAQEWNRAVRDLSRPVNHKDNEYSDDDLYESIYEVIRPRINDRDPEVTSTDKSVHFNLDSNSNIEKSNPNLPSSPAVQIQGAKTNNSVHLMKLAEAANKKMKKMKNELNLTTGEITRSLLRMNKKNGHNVDNSTVPGNRRKATRKPAINKLGPDSDKMFYITLTIEEDGGEESPLNIHTVDSDIESSTYSQMSIDSGGYLVPDQGAHSSSRRKTSRSYSIMRPMVPPPAPPSFNSSISSNSSLTTSLTYQTSSNSVYSNSSSGSSESREENSDSLLLCDSLKEFYTGFCNGEDSLESNSGPLEETYSSSLFQTEPLYQFYHSTDVQHQYEPVQGTLGVPDVWAVKKKRSSAMSIILNSTGRRTLWAELSEVKESGILRSMNEAEKILQESLFEVISSEASYLKSLNILISHFVQSPTLSGETAVITKREQRILFSEALLVRSCSERFLSDLESAWQESVLLHGIPEIVRYHAKTHFQVYVKYCSNQIYQDRMLKKLRLENPKFVEALKELESSQKCQSLAMHSFLMLPMQRITRLPLLAEAVLSRLPSDSAQLTAAREAVNVLNGLVTECNESARSMERMEELLILSQQLDFRDLKAVPIISASRWLVKKGNVTKICLREGGETAKLTFGRRIQKYQLTLILLTDLLLVLKKKGEDKYSVQDYCPRNMIQVMDNDGLPGICEAGSFPLWITLLQNSESRTQELLLSFNSASNRRAWADLLTPQPSQIAGEKIYEDWDCPRVEANTNYTPENENEVGLEKGEVANVLKKSQGIILELTETESSRL